VDKQDQQVNESRRLFMRRCGNVAAVAPAVAIVLSASGKPSLAKSAYGGGGGGGGGGSRPTRSSGGGSRRRVYGRGAVG